MQVKAFGSRNEIIFPPTLSRPITAAGKETVQHGQIDSSFDIKLVVTFLEYGAQHVGDPTFLPEPRKDQVRPDPTNRHRFDLSSRMGIKDCKTFAMAQP